MLASVLWTLVVAPVPVAGQAAEEPGAAAEVTETAGEELEGLDDFDLDFEPGAEFAEGGGPVYDPAGRRDPFKSLLAARQRPEAAGPRPEGVPGLLIDEIDVTGIFVTAAGPVAQVRSTEQEKSYLLHEGDQLYDGDVVSITSSELVLKQIVDDPTAIKPFREVVKTLNPE